VADYPDYETINPPKSNHHLRGSKTRGKTAPRRAWMLNIDTGEWIEMARREERQVPRATFFFDADGNRYRFIELGQVVHDSEDE
jgi:hypothetical protein